MTVGVRTTVNGYANGGRVLHRVYRDIWEGGETKLWDRAFCGFKPRRGWLVASGLPQCKRCLEREAKR